MGEGLVIAPHKRMDVIRGEILVTVEALENFNVALSEMRVEPVLENRTGC
jgi:hypothetical protein